MEMGGGGFTPQLFITINLFEQRLAATQPTRLLRPVDRYFVDTRRKNQRRDLRRQPARGDLALSINVVSGRSPAPHPAQKSLEKG